MTQEKGVKIILKKLFASNLTQQKGVKMTSLTSNKVEFWDKNGLLVQCAVAKLCCKKFSHACDNDPA